MNPLTYCILDARNFCDQHLPPVGHRLAPHPLGLQARSRILAARDGVFLHAIHEAALDARATSHNPEDFHNQTGRFFPDDDVTALFAASDATAACRYLVTKTIERYGNATSTADHIIKR